MITLRLGKSDARTNKSLVFILSSVDFANDTVSQIVFVSALKYLSAKRGRASGNALPFAGVVTHASTNLARR